MHTLVDSTLTQFQFQFFNWRKPFEKSLSWRLNNNNREFNSHLFLYFSLLSIISFALIMSQMFWLSFLFLGQFIGFVRVDCICMWHRIHSHSFSISQTFVQIIATILFQHIISHYILLNSHEHTLHILQSHSFLEDLRSNDNFTA